MMKIKFPANGYLLAGLTLLAVIGVTTLVAQQDKKPQTWEEHKAARFKGLSDDQKKQIAEGVPAKATAKPKKARKVLAM